ncbi:MAG: hypothetical protein COB51_06530 [Moraxellaceae bacterium]|nr:MAG: hypothetical protein COB51_06530 [Moraxellaceae bacterium]
MQCFKKILTVLLWPVVSATVFTSQTLCAEDLIQAYHHALSHSPSWRAAEYKYRADQQVTGLSKANLLPKVTFSAHKSYSGRTYPIRPNDVLAPRKVDSFNNLTASLEFRQPLFDLENWIQHKKSKPLTKASKTELNAAKQDLMIEVVISYFNVLKTVTDVIFSDMEHAAIRKQLEQTQQRHKAGVTAQTEVEEAQAVYDLSKIDVILAANGLAIEKEMFESLTGSSAVGLYPLKDSSEIETLSLLTAAEWAGIAQRNNLQVRQAELNLESAQYESNLQKSKHLPRLDLTANYDYISASGGFFAHSKLSNIALQVNLPLYSGGSVRIKAQQARYLESAQKQQLQLALRIATQETKNLYRTVMTDVQRVSARRQAIKSSQSALRATHTGYKEGIRNVVDVLQAQRNYFAAKRDYAYARFDYLVDYLRLRHSAGILTVDDLVAFNQFLDPEGE